MSDAEQHRERCYGCYRPVTHCFCDVIPTVNNQTNVLILQHTRERFHAFNTARIVDRALVNSRMEVGFTPELAARQDAIHPNAGLLYPGEGARLIEDVAPADRPQQIVVLDGTWHHAKTMIRDIGWLRDLPRFRIDPASPSQYRIRREPSIESLSTVEATVDILRSIEPETPGLDDLLTAFNTMIDRHIAVIGTAEPRHRERSNGDQRVATNIPRSLLGDENNIVVAYGESVPCHPDRKSENAPVVWSAIRLATGELFHELVEPPYPLAPQILEHMRLQASAFEAAVTRSELSQRWKAFTSEHDTVFVFSKGTRALLGVVAGTDQRCELLKSISFTDATGSTLSELLASLGVQPEPAALPARAGKRLANAVALVRCIRR
ncbi:MAG: tRNA-uridine aminocarboxypropyltransferase [Planctomycetaceae bacterium]